MIAVCILSLIVIATLIWEAISNWIVWTKSDVRYDIRALFTFVPKKYYFDNDWGSN